MTDYGECWACGRTLDDWGSCGCGVTKPKRPAWRRAVSRIGHLWIGITPFIWHWPHMDRRIEADPVLRFGPVSIAGIWRI